MVSRALAGCWERGSTQHSRRAHGDILMTSGGSTPMFRHRTRATATVFRRSLPLRQRDTRDSPSSGLSPSASPDIRKLCRICSTAPLLSCCIHLCTKLTSVLSALHLLLHPRSTCVAAPSRAPCLSTRGATHKDVEVWLCVAICALIVPSFPRQRAGKREPWRTNDCARAAPHVTRRHTWVAEKGPYLTEVHSGRPQNPGAALSEHGNQLLRLPDYRPRIPPLVPVPR